MIFHRFRTIPVMFGLLCALVLYGALFFFSANFAAAQRLNSGVGRNNTELSLWCRQKRSNSAMCRRLRGRARPVKRKRTRRSKKRAPSAYSRSKNKAVPKTKWVPRMPPGNTYTHKIIYPKRHIYMANNPVGYTDLDKAIREDVDWDNEREANIELNRLHLQANVNAEIVEEHRGSFVKTVDFVIEIFTRKGITKVANPKNKKIIGQQIEVIDKYFEINQPVNQRKTPSNILRDSAHRKLDRYGKCTKNAGARWEKICRGLLDGF